MDNLIAILAVGGVGIVAAAVVAVVSSTRVRSRGLGRTLWDGVAATDRHRQLYRG